MERLKTKFGFTLIELLVVITIIGILATGAVSVYTSQIQKARDSTRLTDITAVRGGIEQFYQDKAQYPDSTDVATSSYRFSGVETYTPKLPKDPKTSTARTNAAFDYIYTVGQDANSVPGQDFEISCTFEQDGNIDAKAVNTADGGNDDDRYELGIDLTGNSTNVTGAIPSTVASKTCVLQAGTTTACSAASARLVIRGN